MRKKAAIARRSLPLSRAKWIYAAEIPENDGLSTFNQQVIDAMPQRAVIRGCSQQLAELLRNAGWGALQVGAEAVIDLCNPALKKRSLRDLVRRGQRHGHIIAAPPSPATSEALQQLAATSRHGQEPQLQYLFRTNSWADMRCFALQDRTGQWLGAITLSQPGHQMLHTEMLLKHRNAPAGIMEALICHAAEILQQEGLTQLSLGEVPFVSPVGLSDLKSKAFFRIGRTLRFAYDYQGLYQFKQKFGPDWQPVYLCARPGVSWLMLADLFVTSRYLHLARYRLISRESEL